MAISSYEVDGKIFWKVYVNARGKKDRSIRKQKLIKGLSSEKEAHAEEKKWLRIMTEEVMSIDSQGAIWEKVIFAWEMYAKSNLFDSYSPNTIKGYISALFTWTKPWLKRLASELNQGDARQVFKELKVNGRSFEFTRQLKNTINMVYHWGIEERMILGVNRSPVEGVKLEKESQEKIPEILTREQIKLFLYEAKKQKHEWYPIWAVALLTGMRNGELYALMWEKVDLQLDVIRVDCSYDGKGKRIKSTKAGYWRNVPISPQLKSVLIELKANRKGDDTDSEFVLARNWIWNHGSQAQVLRQFCKEIGIPSVRFHTLRACFATHLLADGVPQHKVMAVCGWRDTKTMDVYARLAGIDVAGATDSLEILPIEGLDDDNVIQLA